MTRKQVLKQKRKKRDVLPLREAPRRSPQILPNVTKAIARIDSLLS